MICRDVKSISVPVKRRALVNRTTGIRVVNIKRLAEGAVAEG